MNLATWYDVLRVIVIVEFVAVLLCVVVTMRDHFRRAHFTHSKRSRHITKVALSHLGALAYIGTEVALRKGKPTLLLPLEFLFVTLTLSALLDLHNYQKYQRSMTVTDKDV